MHDLNWYLNTARERHNIHSDNQLARILGIAAPSLFRWRQGQAWPKTKYMIELAHLCEVPEREALIDLMIWSDNDGRSIWKAISNQLKNVAVTGLIVFSVAHMAPTAKASTLSSISNTSENTMYIMTK